MNKKTSGYKAQKATKTVRDRVNQVEEFSKYLMNPLKKRHDVFFRSTMVAFKAIRCWLKLKLSKKAPKNWAEKRKRIDDRITKFIRNPKSEASIEEIPDEKEEKINDVYNIQSSIVEEDWKLSQERKISRKCLDTIFWKGKGT